MGRLSKWAWLAAYLATVPLANWMIGHVGFGNYPRLLPVGFGLVAPSGVVTIGLALCLRDLVRESFGRLVAVVAVLVGAAGSMLIAAPALAVASGAAFLASETLDSLVYEWIRRHGLLWAILLSGAAGLTLDSLLFLMLAFGSVQYAPGQIVGKAWAVVFATMVAWAWNRARRGA